MPVHARLPGHPGMLVVSSLQVWQSSCSLQLVYMHTRAWGVGLGSPQFSAHSMKHCRAGNSQIVWPIGRTCAGEFSAVDWGNLWSFACWLYAGQSTGSCWLRNPPLPRFLHHGSVIPAMGPGTRGQESDWTGTNLCTSLCAKCEHLLVPQFVLPFRGSCGSPVENHYPNLTLH